MESSRTVGCGTGNSAHEFLFTLFVIRLFLFDALSPRGDCTFKRTSNRINFIMPLCDVLNEANGHQSLMMYETSHKPGFDARNCSALHGDAWMTEQPLLSCMPLQILQ